MKASALTDETVSRITALMDKDFLVEGQVRRSVQQHIAHIRRHPVLSRHSTWQLPVRSKQTILLTLELRKGVKKTGRQRRA